MQPTYSICEIKQLLRMRTIELDEVSILQDIVNEESAAYTPREMKAISQMIGLRIRFLGCCPGAGERSLRYN